jgi:hypothetical protein
MAAYTYATFRQTVEIGVVLDGGIIASPKTPWIQYLYVTAQSKSLSSMGSTPMHKLTAPELHMSLYPPGLTIKPRDSC